MKEPIAWINQDVIAWITSPRRTDKAEIEAKLFKVHSKGFVPLYTAPRELSDEEIKAIANNLTCTPDKNWNVLFARAVLKKASEK